MIEKQNVTLAVPKEILRKAKIVAIDRHTSLSGLMVELLTELVEQEERYDQARRDHMRMIAESPSLGTYGKLTWTRDSLHEREDRS